MAISAKEYSISELLHEFETDSEEDSEDQRHEHKKSMMQHIEGAFSGDQSKVVFHDTPSDTWGAFLYVLVKDVGDLTGAGDGEISQGQIMQLAFTMLAMVFNLSLQFGTLWCLNDYVVTPAVQEVQTQYAYFHSTCFDSAGVFNKTTWDKVPAKRKDELCDAALLTAPGFLFGILILWLLAMLAEFRENFQFQKHIQEVPTLPPTISEADMVIEREYSGGCDYFLVALSPICRFLIYVLVIIPKYIVILVLTLVGFRYLSASVAFSDIILNSLALAFVVSVDDMIFNGLFPEIMKERVCSLKWAIPQGIASKEGEVRDIENERLKSAYTRSTVIIISACLFLFCYGKFFQRVIPDYRGDLIPLCEAKKAMDHPKLPCPLFSFAPCFPKGPGYPLVEV